VIEERAAMLGANERDLILSRFGFWYQSGVLDAQWSDARLVALLRAGCLPEPGFRMFQALAERAAAAPGRAVEIAGLYLALADDGWETRSVASYVAAVQEAGRRSSDPDVRRRAAELQASQGSRQSAAFA
jgi:hypothetical protein